MFIYHVHRNGEGSYDELEAAVVIAVDEYHARCLAAEHKGDEGKWLWFTDQVTIELIGTALPVLSPGLICMDKPPG